MQIYKISREKDYSQYPTDARPMLVHSLVSVLQIANG